MLRRQGHVPTPDASRHLQRLCYHFSRKITVSYDEHLGQAAFPWGHCTLKADAQALHFDCQASNADDLGRIQHAIDSHVELFSRKNPVSVSWQAVDVQSP